MVAAATAGAERDSSPRHIGMVVPDMETKVDAGVWLLLYFADFFAYHHVVVKAVMVHVEVGFCSYHFQIDVKVTVEFYLFRYIVVEVEADAGTPFVSNSAVGVMHRDQLAQLYSPVCLQSSGVVVVVVATTNFLPRQFSLEYSVPAAAAAVVVVVAVAVIAVVVAKDLVRSEKHPFSYFFPVRCCHHTKVLFQHHFYNHSCSDSLKKENLPPDPEMFGIHLCCAAVAAAAAAVEHHYNWTPKMLVPLYSRHFWWSNHSNLHSFCHHY